MAAGALRERVTVLSTPAPVSDGQGGQRPGPGPATETTVWARVQALNGTAQLALGAVATGQVYTVTIRANGPAATPPTTRLRWNNTTLTVNAVAPAERRDYLVLTCFDNGRN